MDWEKFRRNNKSIDLYEAWVETQECEITIAMDRVARNFISKVENYQEIKSRQVAALVLAQVDWIVNSTLR